jgi:hypothetical protein
LLFWRKSHTEYLIEQKKIIRLHDTDIDITVDIPIESYSSFFCECDHTTAISEESKVFPS